MLVSISSVIPCILPLTTLKSGSNVDIFLDGLEYFSLVKIESYSGLLVNKTSVEYSEAATGGVLYKKVFLKVSQILQ